MNDTQSKTAGSAEAVIESLRFWVEPAREYGASTEVVDWEEAQKAIRATLSHPVTQAGALQAGVSLTVAQLSLLTGRKMLDLMREAMAHGITVETVNQPFDALPFLCTLAATQPNAAPAAEVVASEKPTFDDYMYCKHCGRVIVWDDWSFTHLDGWANCRKAEQPSELNPVQHCEPLLTHRIAPQPKSETEAMSLPVLVFVVDGNGVKHAWRKGEPMPILTVAAALAAPAAAIDAREQEVPECERCGLSPKEHTPIHWCGNQSYTLAARNSHDEALMKLSQFAHTAALMSENDMRNNLSSISDQLIALASRSEAPEARPNAAGQEPRWLIARETVISDIPDSRPSLGYTVFADPFTTFETAERASEALRELNLPLGWVRMKTNQEPWASLFPATPPLEAVGSSGMTADQAQGGSS